MKRFAVLGVLALWLLFFGVFYSVGAVTDTTPPSLGTPAISPSSPNSTQSVTVSVSAYDPDSGVAWVKVNYVDYTTNQTINAIYSPASDSYQATIPATSNGTEVDYRAIASDIAGNVAMTAWHSYMVRDTVSTGTGCGGSIGGIGFNCNGSTGTSTPTFPFPPTTTELMIIFMGGFAAIFTPVFVTGYVLPKREKHSEEQR